MARLHHVRRWSAVGLLVVLTLTSVGSLPAQDRKQSPAVANGNVPPVSVMPELILESTPDSPITQYLPPPPDDGLGPATPIVPGRPAAACADGVKSSESRDRFSQVPPVALLPRPGFNPILPTGPGYYTLFEFLEDEEREGPPKYPYPRISPIFSPFFDIDWRYLDDPNNTETDFWDFLKRRRFGPDDCCLFTSGGEIRARYTHEVNSRLIGRINNYDLYRVLVFADLYLTERFRVFVEFLSATSPNYLLPPAQPDIDVADFLNLFVDAHLLDVAETPVWLRVGRQELLYGSQRLVSPPDWNNARRTFQGAKLFWHGAKDDVDLFCVQPVIPNPGRLDSVDNNIVFAGLWYTHRPKPGSTIDAYYLMVDNTSPTFEGKNGKKGGQTVHTFGTRWVGDKDNWLWDVEAMVQCGEHVDQGVFARAFTVGGGYHFKDTCATPTFWLYYDYASGTPEPGQGTLFQTFDTLFPFGHYYLGWVDIVGRKNINDVNCELTFFPAKWLFTQIQCHNFWLDSAKDALFSPGGAPLRRDKTGNAGNYVGTELDFIVNFHLTLHSDILFAYGHLFAGRFLIDTAKSEGEKRNPQAVYVQYSYRW